LANAEPVQPNSGLELANAFSVMFISDKDKVRLGDYGICSALGLYKVIVTEQSTDAMHELSFEKVDVLKLARAYVALALAQDEAKRYGSQHSVQAALLPL